MDNLENKTEIPGIRTQLVEILFHPLGITKSAIRCNRVIEEKSVRYPGESIIGKIYVGLGLFVDIGKLYIYGSMIYQTIKHFS